MKGIIISHENGGSYVMGKDGILVFAKGHTSLPIGTEVPLLPRAARLPKRFALAAACLVLAFVVSTSFLWNTQAYCIEVSTDMSISFSFNLLNLISGAQGLNHAGVQWLKDNNVVGKQFSQMHEILQTFYHDSGNASAAPTVCITLITDDANRRDALQQELYHLAQEAGLDESSFALLASNGSQIQATQYNTSIGQLTYAQQLASLDTTVPLQEIIDLPIQDIALQINALTEQPSEAAEAERASATDAAQKDHPSQPSVSMPADATPPANSVSSKPTADPASTASMPAAAASTPEPTDNGGGGTTEKPEPTPDPNGLTTDDEMPKTEKPENTPNPNSLTKGNGETKTEKPENTPNPNSLIKGNGEVKTEKPEKTPNPNSLTKGIGETKTEAPEATPTSTNQASGEEDSVEGDS